MRVLSPILLLVLPLALSASPPAGDWFVFAPSNTTEPGRIGLADWLHRPAGKHGFVQMDGDRLVFADGTPLKLWGTNHGNQGVAPTPEEATRRAAWYAKMGLNAVRFHKFTWPVDGRHGNGLGDPHDSTRLDPALLDRMDHYHAKLRDHGIYVTWSHIFGHRPMPGDRGRLMAYDEIVTGPQEHFLGNSTYGVVNLFEDMQALNIELTLNLLNHRNPYTGLRYADDPALAFIELQNEDNAWWSAGQRIQSMPTYRALLARQFCAWLREKYGSHAGVVAAWGASGLERDEHLDRENIFPPPDRTRYQPAVIAASPAPQRLIDSARFLHERQLDFYQRFAAAIRTTGYAGVIVGSCWKADDGLPHYYNLLADHAVGMIDRHNYFGSRAHNLTAGQEVGRTGSMLAEPNLGLLGIGLTQTSDRPFSFSEWTSKSPNEWVAEGPAVVAYYGLGLQDWDASFHFASSHAGFSSQIISPNVYNTNSPTQVGLFPALARAVYRGDIRPGDPVMPRRRISEAALARGDIGFIETTRTTGDENVLTGTIPATALAVGRVVLDIVEEADWAPTPSADLTAWIEDDGTVRSNTGELFLQTRHGGSFSVNAAATKALVGFTGGEPQALGDVTLTVQTPFAVIILTAREPDRDLNHTRSALLTVMARAQNSGQNYNAERTVLETVGTAPILLEGVTFTLAWPRLNGASIRVLDHDGLPTDRVVQANAGARQFNTAQDQALYYEISWP
jgi:hypothetical protein